MTATHDYAQWFERNVAALLDKKDREKILQLGAKMQEVGLLFKQAGLNRSRAGNDCDTEAGGGGSCGEHACLSDGGGGDCSTNSCINSSGGGDCGNNVCDACASKV